VDRDRMAKATEALTRALQRLGEGLLDLLRRMVRAVERIARALHRLERRRADRLVRNWDRRYGDARRGERLHPRDARGRFKPLRR
jgi:hypothetical protein